MNLKPIYEGNEIQFCKLFTATWRLYRTHFIPILVLTVIGGLPSLYTLCFVPVTPRPTFGSFFANAVIGSILWLLSYMSIMSIVDDGAAGRSTSIVAAFRKAVSRLPVAITTGLLTIIKLFGWWLLLFIPGMIKSVRYSFTLQAVVLRKVAHSEAIRYSMKLVDDYWWTVVIADFFIGLPGFILGLPFILKGPDTLANVHGLGWGMAVVQILITGFWHVGNTLLFLVLEQIKTNATDVASAPPPVPEE